MPLTDPQFSAPGGKSTSFLQRKNLGFQWDLARQVERLDWLLAQLPRYAEWGYNELYLHLEDAVEYPSLPGVARSDAYTYREFQRLVSAATKAGIKVVPIVNLLGHTQYLIKRPELRDLNELRAPDGSPLERGQICPLHPRTLEVAEKLLRDMAPFCTAGKVHVGLDESFHLGKCPRCRADIRRRGRAAHFATYVHQLRGLAVEQGLHLGLWADMLYFVPDAVPLLPRDVAVYEWYYYNFPRRPRVELFNYVESDLGERLCARGNEYWGCPMNGAFRYEPMPHFRDRLENILSWWRHCQRLNATGFLMTSWEPNRLALELTTVVDAAAASLWLDRGVSEPAEMLERGFARVFGRKTARRSAQVALACDRFPFGGYPRWEINSNWNTVSRRESVGEYRREEKYFRELARTGRKGRTSLPGPLQTSVEFRHYLAQRDLAVRTADERETLPAAIAAGQQAAKAMWASTRERGTHGPNEEILRADAARLKDPTAFEPKWQLCYVVNNFQPGAHLVAVEQKRPDGKWETLQACHTHEFQNRAARRHGGLRREHAAPVDWDGSPQTLPRLRLVLRGLGQVKLEDVALTNGTSHFPLRLRRKIIGRPVPLRGWPALDWTRNRDAIEVRLGPSS